MDWIDWPIETAISADYVNERVLWRLYNGEYTFVRAIPSQLKTSYDIIYLDDSGKEHGMTITDQFVRDSDVAQFVIGLPEKR